MKVDNIIIFSEVNFNENIKLVNYNLMMNVLISLIVGLFLVIGFVFLLEYFDDIFKIEDEIEKEFGILVLVVIFKLKKEDVCFFK